MVRQDLEEGALVVATLNSPIRNSSGITPDFLSWLEKFNDKHKAALLALSKK